MRKFMLTVLVLAIVLAAFIFYILTHPAKADAAADFVPVPAKVENGIPVEPDPTLTPGAVNPDVIDPKLTKEVLCDPKHHTSEDRDVDETLKLAIYRRYGLEPIKTSKGWNFHVGYCNTKEGCEVDHLCSLENGCTNSIYNLWVEPYAGVDWNAHKKDVLENKLHKLMCAGTITLQQDQMILSTDWISGYNQYVGTSSGK